MSIKRSVNSNRRIRMMWYGIDLAHKALEVAKDTSVGAKVVCAVTDKYDYLHSAEYAKVKRGEYLKSDKNKENIIEIPLDTTDDNQ